MAFSIKWKHNLYLKLYHENARHPRLTLLFPRNPAMVTLPKWRLGPQQWSVGTSRSHLKIHPVEKRDCMHYLEWGPENSLCNRKWTGQLPAKHIFQGIFPKATVSGSHISSSSYTKMCLSWVTTCRSCALKKNLRRVIFLFWEAAKMKWLMVKWLWQ